MAEHRHVAPDEDPVCGMTVEIEGAKQKGLATTYDGHDYVFCGRGCYLDFRENPETFLMPGYRPAM
jgi:YHS domain-containing protein